MEEKEVEQVEMISAQENGETVYHLQGKPLTRTEQVPLEEEEEDDLPTSDETALKLAHRDNAIFDQKSCLAKMRWSARTHPRSFFGYLFLISVFVMCAVAILGFVIYAAKNFPGPDEGGPRELSRYMDKLVEDRLHEKWARELQQVADTQGEGSRSAFGNPLGDRQIYNSKKGGFDASVDWLKSKLAAHAPSASIRTFDTPVRFMRQDKPTVIAPVQLATPSSSSSSERKRAKARPFVEWMDYVLMRGFEGRVDKKTIRLIYLEEEKFCNTSAFHADGGAADGCTNCGFIILRGECTFHQKLENVLTVFPSTRVLFVYDAEQPVTVDTYAAPLEGSLYASQENPDELNPNLSPLQASRVPVFGVSNRFMDYYRLLLRGEESLYVQLYVEAYSNVTTSQDTCASFKPSPSLLNRTHHERKKLVCGAHIDSVSAGPGMNDNGSGTLGILSVAYLLHKMFFENVPESDLEVEVELCWWASEEEGLFGSRRYAATELDTKAEIREVLAYLNLDMIASPNHVYGVMDPDVKTSMKIVPSALMETRALRDSLRESLRVEGVYWTNVEIDDRSDHAPFAEKGVPVGGLFTGAEKRKTLQERRIWGGIAGAAYDPCYHSKCDTFDNLNLEAWEKNMRAFVRTLSKLIL